MSTIQTPSRIISFVLDYKITGRDSLNTIYAGTHWRKRGDYAASIKLLVAHALKNAKIPRRPAGYPVHITLTFPPDNLDIDNHSYFTKCVIDALKGEIIRDDNKAHVVGVTQRFEKRSGILVAVAKGD